MSETKLKEIIEEVCGMYRRQYQNRIIHIFMYGSYARGDNTDGSDIDLVAIVDGERLELQDKLKSIWTEAAMLGYENDVIISPMVIPRQEFEDYKEVLPYYRNIVREGVHVG